MKKLLLVLVAVMGLTFAATAQDSGKAIGVRFGGGSSYNTEFTYQQDLRSINRLELDLGVNPRDLNFFYVAGVFQWKGGINEWLGWYAGPGAKVSYCINHGVGVAVAGQGGVEANFASIPFLQFSLDVRPEYEFLLPEGCINSFNWALALSVRYKL